MLALFESLQVVCTFGVLIIFLLFLALAKGSLHVPSCRPPGPPPLPFIGNLLDIPLKSQWITWQSYMERYGDVVYLSALGQNFLLLGSHDAISDLLEKRISFNNRPRSVMLNDLMDFEWVLPLAPFGPALRRSRRLLNSFISIRSAEAYRPLQMNSARCFVRDLLTAELTRPSDKLSEEAIAVLPRIIRVNFGRTIVRMAYGIDVRGSAMEAQFIDIAEEVIMASNKAATPGRFLVEFLPWLKHVPGWVPGAEFRTFASKIKQYHIQMRKDAVAVTKAQMAEGSAPPSIVASFLEEFPDNEQLASDIGGTVYLAGSDTTVGAVTSYFLAALVFPEIQKRAQEELDRVVGRERLPEYTDREYLPYLEGVMRECLRWLPVLPNGVPHATDSDETYRGYLIPKDTVVIPLQWSLLHNSATYSDPSRFSPERYLTKCPDGAWKLHGDIPDPRSYAFGFGRRVCPGIHITDQGLFATLATVIHTIDVIRARNSQGEEIVPDVRVGDSGISHALPFPYELRVREDANDLVEMCNAASV